MTIFLKASCRAVIIPFPSLPVLVLFNVCRWRKACTFLELPVKVRHVVKSAVVADLGDIHICISEQLTRLGYPYLNQKLNECFTRVLFEKMTKCSLTIIRNTGYILQHNLFLVVLKDVIDNFVNLLTLMIGQRCIGINRREVFINFRNRQIVKDLQDSYEPLEFMSFGDFQHPLSNLFRGTFTEFQTPAGTLNQFSNFRNFIDIKKAFPE